MILVAEDEADIRRLVAGHLRQAGYRVSEAADGVETVLLATAEVPDLILLDIRMPGMSGVEALRVLRADERTRAVPVVVMTASPGAIEAHGDELEALGAAVLVRKPFSAADLAATLARVLEPGRAA